jgi:heptosyltransferase II
VIPLGDARRIYVRLPNWVGDVVLATPFLQGLRRAAPRAEVLLHGKKQALPVLAAEGLHDRSAPLGPAKRPWDLVREGRRAVEGWGAPDVAFVLPNSFSSAVIARSTGARERVGYSLNLRRFLLTAPLVAKKEGRLRPTPMVDYYLAMLTRAGASIEGIARRPRLTVTPEQEARADALLARLGLAGGPPIWALNIGGSWETKRWIPEHAGRLAKLLEARGKKALLLVGPDEKELARRAVEAAGGPIAGADEVVPLTDLTATLRRCEAFITTDSGPRHFGVAAGIPVVALIGSTHPGYTQVDYPALDLLCEQVDCWPCHLKTCPIDFRCMTRLTPERAIEATERLLARVRVSP